MECPPGIQVSTFDIQMELIMCRIESDPNLQRTEIASVEDAQHEDVQIPEASVQMLPSPRSVLDSTESSRSITSSIWTYRGGKNASGQFHGKGTLTVDGSTYDGHFSGSRRNGFGAITNPGGSTYSGGWKDDLHHGHGVYKCPTTGYMYRGHYKLGKRHGRGECHLPNGDKYIGEWENGEMEGAGVYIHTNGDIYEGLFKDGERHGPGGYQCAKKQKLDIIMYEFGVRIGEGVRYNKTRKKIRRLEGSIKGGKISVFKAEVIVRNVCNGYNFGEFLNQLRERHREIDRGIKWQS
mmetsp:Transcript_13645/g.18289  ORF Transcript_13645/g.18289 Transcript_13645/m.18289 type:complete len:294 (+) Transcript_13645:132-1013(+)